MNIINKYKEKTNQNNRQLAESIGKSQRQVYNWLNGSVPIPLTVQYLLESKLEVLSLYSEISNYRALLKTKLNSEV